jgi:hypothetical protein
MFGALGNGGIASKRGSEQPDWGRLAEQGLSEPLVGIEVVNVGRTSTEVQHFSCELTGGFGYANPGLPNNPPLPFRLDPHTPKALWLPLREVLTLAEVIRETGQTAGMLRGTVSVQVAGPRTFRTEPFNL